MKPGLGLKLPPCLGVCGETLIETFMGRTEKIVHMLRYDFAAMNDFWHLFFAIESEEKNCQDNSGWKSNQNNFCWALKQGLLYEMD